MLLFDCDTIQVALQRSVTADIVFYMSPDDKQTKDGGSTSDGPKAMEEAASLLQSFGPGVKPDLLPNVVLRFLERDDETPFANDSEYFEAILAWHAALARVRSLDSGVAATFSVTQKEFANPLAAFYERGRDLRATFQDLADKLDQKRRHLLGRMESPPIIESFLDEMEANDMERRLFYFFLITASQVLVDGRKQDPRDPLHYYGSDGNTTFVPWLYVYNACADFVSLAQLMDLTAIDSKWVKERVYKRCDQPSMSINLNQMEKTAVRCLMGANLSHEQYHSLESPLLQKVLLQNKHFLETDTGKRVHAEQDPTHSSPAKKGDGRDDELDNAEDKNIHLEQKHTAVLNTLSAQLAKTSTKPRFGGDGNILQIIGQMQQEQLDATGDEPMPGQSANEKSDDSVSREKDESNFGPYRSELDYIDDQFRLVELFVELQQLKGFRDGDAKHHYRQLGARYIDPYTGRMISKDDITLRNDRDREKLDLKYQKLKKRVTARIGATEVQRGVSPRLEQLCQALELGNFERFVLLQLIRDTLDPSAARNNPTRMGGHSSFDRVDGFISAYATSLEGKMRCRKFFYKSSPLIREGIISISGQDFSSDLNNCRVVLDRRMFDYIIGQDTELSELVDGSHLYTPSERMEDIVLPMEVKDRICERALHFNAVKQKYGELEINKKITYGLGQIFLFYGSSGTGKTMMANAIAAKLKTKVLLVNFPSLGANSGGIIKLLFREAKIKKAILFFDECESLFRSRQRGNSSINTCLTELERFDDMCILATNLANEIDEAMYRRISLAVEFKKPDHILRERIWQTLQPENLLLDDDVNFKELARKYELSGGFIKNVWLSAVALMVSRDADKVSQADLERAAGEQVIGGLSNEDFDRQVIPSCGIESVIASDQVTESLRTIVDHRKAQAVLFSQWGFEKIHKNQSGVSVLFAGPPGTGKTMAAEAIGFDTGSPLMVVNTAELVNKYVGETGKNIVSIFRDAKRKGAILVFDEGEGLFGSRSTGSPSSSGRHDNINVGLLLQYIESFGGVCIVITNHQEAIDEAFFRRFHFVVKFELPGPRLREQIWKSMIPKECPLSADVSLSTLANRYELCGGDIKSALLRAASRAALRFEEKCRIVSMKDLEESCQEETSKKSNANTVNEHIYM